MALADKKALLLIPPRDFQDDEFDIIRRVLESRGVKVTVASTHLGEARGSKGMTVRPQVLVDDVRSYDYDAIVFLGGAGARQLFDHEKVTKLAKDAEYKVVGAIGQAPQILASAGVVKGKRVTAHPAVAGSIRSKEGTYTGQPLEVDDKLVTAQGGQFAEHFGNALLRALEK